jgi:hypothetical protein
LIRGVVPFIINPYDIHALEKGLRLKEKYGFRVAVIDLIKLYYLDDKGIVFRMEEIR